MCDVFRFALGVRLRRRKDCTAGATQEDLDAMDASITRQSELWKEVLTLNAAKSFAILCHRLLKLVYSCAHRLWPRSGLLRATLSRHTRWHTTQKSGNTMVCIAFRCTARPAQLLNGRASYPDVALLACAGNIHVHLNANMYEGRHQGTKATISATNGKRQTMHQQMVGWELKQSDSEAV